jgi:hypothetical protein
MATTIAATTILAPVHDTRILVAQVRFFKMVSIFYFTNNFLLKGFMYGHDEWGTGARPCQWYFFSLLFFRSTNFHYN